MENFWGGVGASAAIVGVVLAWIQFRATTSGLVAEVYAHRFALPSNVSQNPSIITDVLLILDTVEDLPPKSRQAILRVLNEDMVSKLSTDGLLHRLEAYWTVTIKNNGRNTAEDVGLRVPQAARVRILREGREAVEQEVSALVELASIRPGEAIELGIWGGGIYFMDSRHVRLVQKSGRAKVIRFAHVGPRWKWISEHWGFTLFVGVMSLVTVLQIWATIIAAPSHR